MDQIQRNGAVQNPATNRQAEQPQQRAISTSGRGGNGKKWILVAIVVVLLVVLVAGGAFAYKKATKDSKLVGVDSDRYQSLFLTNGQVYFGKVSEADSETVKIEDIYYLQVQQTVQPEQQQEGEAAQQEQGETSLVKLGEELHGPQDEMYIDRDQVLFWENLKDDGKVVQAINEFKKK